MSRPLALGFATTVTFCALYVACAIAFFNNWFHGIDLAALEPPGGRPITIGAFVAGLAGVVAVAFPAGTLLGWVYERLRRRGAA